MQETDSKQAQRKREVYNEVIDAFGEKYSWLGAQASREMLMSLATWNIHQNSDPDYRVREHVMFAWKRGYVKSTMLRTMADLLGGELTSVIGKVTDAAMRGSVSGGSFTPPKPLKTPIVISTEYGQTNFDDELLNLFLNMLEEGHTNVALNKIAQLPDSQRKNIEEEYDRRVQFGENNEYDLRSDFVFWGATYDPTKLSDDALRSRLNIVTPAKKLDWRITHALNQGAPVQRQLSKETIRDLRRFVQQEKEYPYDFDPPKGILRKHDVDPRENRDVKAYMAARNWWGLETNPDIMQEYVKHKRRSRRLSTMEPEERVFDLIFDSPKSYAEIKSNTDLSKKQIFKIMQRINAKRYDLSSVTKWVIWSGDGKPEEEEEEEEEGSGFLEKYL